MRHQLAVCRQRCISDVDVAGLEEQEIARFVRSASAGHLETRFASSFGFAQLRIVVSVGPTNTLGLFSGGRAVTSAESGSPDDQSTFVADLYHDARTILDANLPVGRVRAIWPALAEYHGATVKYTY